MEIQLCITEINYILKYVKKKKICIFDQINAALMSIRDFFKKHYKFY